MNEKTTPEIVSVLRNNQQELTSVRDRNRSNDSKLPSFCRIIPNCVMKSSSALLLGLVVSVDTVNGSVGMAVGHTV